MNATNLAVKDQIKDHQTNGLGWNWVNLTQKTNSSRVELATTINMGDVGI